MSKPRKRKDLLQIETTTTIEQSRTATSIFFEARRISGSDIRLAKTALEHSLKGFSGTPKQIADNLSQFRDAGEEPTQPCTSKDGSSLCYEFHHRHVYVGVCFKRNDTNQEKYTFSGIQFKH